jgi:hypothetical protein
MCDDHTGGAAQVTGARSLPCSQCHSYSQLMGGKHMARAWHCHLVMPLALVGSCRVVGKSLMHLLVQAEIQGVTGM